VKNLRNLSHVLKSLSDEQGANAAVAVLLKQDKEDFSVFFVKRVENAADPWSGQMAFPGGKRDEMDVDLKQTVVRETLEETGMNLLDCCRFLGVLSVLRSRPRPDLRILPFVVLVEYEPRVKLNRNELEDFCWIPFEELVQSKTLVKFDSGEFPACSVRNKVIWGLTYRILENLFTVVKLSQAASSPKMS
jgi:8-oxo-dGTP pyrophosphatase MutT (NUDIX family)